MIARPDSSPKRLYLTSPITIAFISQGANPLPRDGWYFAGCSTISTRFMGSRISTRKALCLE